MPLFISYDDLVCPACGEAVVTWLLDWQTGRSRYACPDSHPEAATPVRYADWLAAVTQQALQEGIGDATPSA